MVSKCIGLSRGPLIAAFGRQQAFSSRCRASGRVPMRSVYGRCRRVPVIYVEKLERAVYVLHAFQKTTRKTRQAYIRLAARRYKAIGDEP